MGLSGDIGSLLALVNSRRVLAIQGHYGSHKTAIAFRLAIELCEAYDYQHIVSNCGSVLTDDLSTIELDDLNRLNTVVVLDEAGEFIEKAADTKGWLAFLRKLNVCLLLPTVDNLPKRVTKLELSRTDNYQSLGFDMVTFGISLDGGMTKDEKFKVNWRNPSEIFGLYDTDAFPSDADEILDFLREKTSQAASKRGYDKTATKYQVQVRSLFGGGENVEISGMETSGGQTHIEQEIQTLASDAVPVPLVATSSRRGAVFANALSRLNPIHWFARRYNITHRQIREKG